MIDHQPFKFDFLTQHWTINLSFHFNVALQNREIITYHVFYTLRITKNLFLKNKLLPSLITNKPKNKGFDRVFERVLVKMTTTGDCLTPQKKMW